ncbi:hypothetical protein B5X24_HaOG209576 [Helicoverpa armigera]|nr:hypothetical protein B5X24_HaOG209576 [Helicoverpa armigera]
MATTQRTPPKTTRSPASNIIKSQTRSEPDITTACDFVNKNRYKRARHGDSPEGTTVDTDTSSQEPEIQDILDKWKKEQDARVAELLADQKKFMAQLSSDIRDIKTQNSKIQASNSEISKSNVGIVQSIEFFNKKFEDLKMEVELLRKERREQQTYIECLEQRIVDLQHKSRSSAIELRNIPQATAESSTTLTKTVCQAGAAVGVHINESELRDIYRLPNKSATSTSPRPIVAEFTTVQTKQTLLSAVRAFNKGRGKDDKLNTTVMGLSGDRLPVYISDHLPACTKKLFYQAREFAAKYSFKYCWIANGNIFLRKIDGDKQILIRSAKCLSPPVNQVAVL